MSLPRATVFLRLVLILAGVGALPTAILMGLQERALARDLREAAAARLDRAARASTGLVEDHLEAIGERFRAVSGTPQFRAALELGDPATLRFYADELAQREGALAVLFATPDGADVAGGEIPELARLARSGVDEPLFEHEGRLYSLTVVPLFRGAAEVGSLVAVEALSEAQLGDWSETCGATIHFERGELLPSEPLVRVLRTVGEGALVVTASLESEQRALANARANLATAGVMALAFALAASIMLSRGWARPILEIKRSAERIGRGDFDARIGTERSDEIGDVARAFDVMATRLGEYSDQVGAQQSALQAQVRALDEGRERLRSAQRLARMGSWRLDVTSGRVEVSEELRDILGLGADAADLGVKDLLSWLHPDDREAVVSTARSGIAQRSSLHADHRVVLPNGHERVLQTQAQFRADAPDVLEGTSQDVTERKRTEEQIRYLAYHDALTGLGNRRLFQERVDLAVVEAKRSQCSFGVLFLDLDLFKRINDTLGHSVGDQLLEGVAERLVGCVRGSDVIARQKIEAAVSRFGGDEFTVLVEGASGARDLARIARRLLGALAEPFQLDGHEVVISASIGIATWPDDGADGEALLRNADTAMYHAKGQGRNNYQFYAAAMNEEALQRLVLESRFRRALESEAFEVYYQPKLDATGEEVLGVEALARWRDPELGMIPPNEFVQIAEETGQINALGEWVLRRACEDRCRWNAAGLPRVPVAVNLSAHQFRGGALADTVARVLEEAGLPAAQLELEITESTLLHDEATVVESLHAIRSLGARVAVDDFGTGYSSLAYLGRLPVDALKIDRSFITGIAEHPDEEALAAAIVSVGRALSLRIVAEGVEDEPQRALLAGWGVDELQGFLFSRPLPEAELLGWWRGRLGRQGDV